jgi:hypothetical protein
LMAHCRGRLDAYVLLEHPEGVSDEWVKSDLWNRASTIPGVSVLEDRRGTEAQHFRALTSGQVFLYGADGRLLFSGGITAARGHVGDNPGRLAIESLVNSGTAERDHSVVFGCPLFNPESECRNLIDEKIKN